MIRDDGKVIEFSSDGNGGYVAPPDQPYELTEDLGSTTARWVLRTPSDDLEEYSDLGLLTKLANRAGQEITFQYNASDQLETIQHYTGRTLVLAYNPSGLVASMADPAGNVYSYQYDTQQNLDEIVFPDDTPLIQSDNPTRLYHYEDPLHPNHLTGVTDENGDRYATWAYDGLGRAISSEHAGATDRTEVMYNADGSATVKNALGKDTTYQTVIQHGVVKATQIDGHPTTLCGASTSSVEYDSNGFVSSRTDWNGNTTDYVLNPDGTEWQRLEAVGTPSYRTFWTTWHADFRVPTEIQESGKRTTFTYDLEGRLLTRTVLDLQNQSVPYSTIGNSITTTFTYNAMGLLSTVDGPRTSVSDVTTYDYDASGDLWMTTNALSQTTEIVSRNSRGLPTAIDDINDVRTELAYDARGRLIARTIKSNQGDAVTSFGYDAVGQLTSVTLPNASGLAFEYDAAHRLTAIQNDIGERIEYTLDAAGNRTGEVIKDDLGTITKTQSRVFDELSQLRELIGAATQTTTFTYDDNGNQTSIEDGLSRTTSQAYDALDRLITVTDPLLNEATYDYDDRDNLTTVADPRGVVTSYVYDGLDNLIQEASADAGTSVHLYDDSGNLTQTTDGRGVVVQYSYDALNRVTAAIYPADTSENVTYTYDQGVNGEGRLTSVQDASGSTDYSYDDRGNVVQETRLVSGVIYVTSYSYDLADNLVSMTYPSGRAVNYIRDGMGRVTSITTQLSGGPLETVISSVAYQPFGGTAGWTAGNGIAESRTYDLDYRVNSISAGGILDRSYSYNLSESIDGITDVLDGSRTQSFGYDELQRLTSATGIYGNQSYTYDEVGNRLTFNDGVSTENSTYGANDNRLASSTSWDYQYDGGGNQTSRLVSGDADGTLYAYNERNRLETVTDRAGGSDTLLATYDYNALGQRVEKIGSDSVHYVFDTTGALITESDTLGNPAKDYIYLEGRLVGIVQYPPAIMENVVLDDTDPSTSQTGTWINKTHGTQYQSNYLLAKKNTSATFRWTPSLQGGVYEVYAWWVARNNHNTSVTYSISHDGQTSQVVENHRQNGGQWVLLGTYTFTGTGSEYVEVSDQGGNSVADGIRFQQIASVGGPELKFVHTDHLGTPQVILDDAQQVVWAADFEPFGFASITNGSLDNNVRFPGQYFDVESGLHYNYFRTYDPSTGRYLASDPIGLWGGTNTYEYVYSNPLAYYDPYGLWALGDPLPQGFVDFSAGLGDALLLGQGQQIRDLIGVSGDVNKCSAAYDYGSYAALAAGGGRLAYGGLAKGGSILASSGAQASAFRQSLKTFFRGGIGRNWRPPNLVGKTDAQLRASAGKTNVGINAYGVGVTAAAVVRAAQCGCEQ